MLTCVHDLNKIKNILPPTHITIVCYRLGNKYKIKNIDKSKFRFFIIIELYKCLRKNFTI